MRKPKILIYDIETTPNLGYIWGKYEQNVLAYERERELLCFSYKWVGSSKVISVSRKHDKTDQYITKKLATLLNEADIVVAHNGDNFDRKIVKTRMLYWGMKPLKTNCSIDTLKAARTYFKFNGNTLSDLSKFLGLGIKVSPGIDIWLGCIANKASSWEKMLKYNKQDVCLLSKVYDKLLPWIENAPNLNKILNPHSKSLACPSCSSNYIHKYGFRATASGVMQRWCCNDCGKPFNTKVVK